jgi:HTH-type transcriptional regulator / antitoxin HipB
MDHQLMLVLLGRQARVARKERGLTQEALARVAAVTRLKVVQIEAGKASVSMEAYARVAAALGQDLGLQPSRRPTLDELEDLLRDDEST